MKEWMFELLELCGVSYGNNPRSIVEATQKAWLREPGSERWEMGEKDFGAEKNQGIRELAARMGFIREVPPPEKNYMYCLLHGSVLPDFQTRLDYVSKLWGEGVRFKKVVILTGQRNLDPKGDRLPFSHACKTETEGVMMLYEKAKLPPEVQALPLQIVDTPKQKGARPTTRDAIRAWLAMNPAPGTCLFISNQPYVIYQESVARNLMPAEFPFITVGSAVEPDSISIAVLLDTIARELWETMI